jgi:uncharacterized membrane protein
VDEPESSNAPGTPTQPQTVQPTPAAAYHLQLPPYVMAQAHSGPIPPPEQLSAYETSFPGAAAWIFNEAKLNSEHVRAMEIRNSKTHDLDVRLKRLLPFALVLSCVIACTAIAIWASPVWGAAGYGATITAVMVAYLREHTVTPTHQSRP